MLAFNAEGFSLLTSNLEKLRCERKRFDGVKNNDKKIRTLERKRDKFWFYHSSGNTQMCSFGNGDHWYNETSRISTFSLYSLTLTVHLQVQSLI